MFRSKNDKLRVIENALREVGFENHKSGTLFSGKDDEKFFIISLHERKIIQFGIYIFENDELFQREIYMTLLPASLLYRLVFDLRPPSRMRYDSSSGPLDSWSTQFSNELQDLRNALMKKSVMEFAESLSAWGFKFGAHSMNK